MSQRESLRIARLLMVLSSISPLFILWAIRGSSLIPDSYFITGCIILVIFPNIFLFLLIREAIKDNQKRNIYIGKWEDHREHLLVYLFTMLLPFFTADLSNWREFITAIVGICFIVFLFWHLNLHYMNIIFAAFGLRIFTIYPTNADEMSGKSTKVLITRRVNLIEGQSITAYRLSSVIFMEV